MIRSVKSLGHKVSSVLSPRAMQSADLIGPNEISHGVPPDVYMFGLVVKDRVIR